MTEFPRTKIEDLSVPRMVIGTNWFLGFSHSSRAKDELIKKVATRRQIADVLEVFFQAGIDCIYGVREKAGHLEEAVKDAEDRTGRMCIRMGTPTLKLEGIAPGGGTPDAKAEGENERILDSFAEIGCQVCLPHQCTTDALTDRSSATIRGMADICSKIRERGMIPGLSTHMPEVPVYADRTELDVGTYIQIYNALGFLMQIEIDWVHRMIRNAKRPVIAIKPFAGGRLHPLVGLAFCWATLRPQDMICVGTMTPDEARELIEISWSLFENRDSQVELQRSRSKASLD